MAHPVQHSECNRNRNFCITQMRWQKFYAMQNNTNSLKARDGRISIFHQTQTESESSLDQISITD